VTVEDWSEADELMEAELVANQLQTMKEGPVQAQRFSKRISRTGAPTLEVAEDRVCKKNLEILGTQPHNPFSILHDVDEQELSNVAINYRPFSGKRCNFKL